MFGASTASCTVIPNSTTFKKNCRRFCLAVTALHSEGKVRLTVLQGHGRRQCDARMFARLNHVERVLRRVSYKTLRALAEPYAGVPSDHRWNPTTARRYRNDPPFFVCRLD